MSPCTIVKITSIYVAVCLSIKTVSSVEELRNLKSNPDSPGGSESQSPITYIDIDVSKTESTEQYEYKQEGDVETYTAKPGFAIKSYSEGTTEKWKSDGIRHIKRICRAKISDNKFRYKTFDFNADQLKVKIVTQDQNDHKKIKENDSSQYDLKDEYDLLEYKFKDGVKCVAICFDNKDVWKRDSTNTNNPYPVSAFLNSKLKSFLLIFKETITILKLDGDQWKSDFSGKPETITLNTKSKKDQDNWSYNKNDKVGTYTAKDGKFFNVVTHKSVEVWKTENKAEYATKVVVNGIGKKEKTARIYMLSGLTKIFNRPGKDKPWTESTTTKKLISGKLEPVSIIIKEKKTTSYFDYDCQDKKHIYTPKEGHGFKEVEFDGYSYYSPSKPKVWNTDKPEEYAIKIEWESSLRKHVFTLHFDNGTTKEVILDSES